MNKATAILCATALVGVLPASPASAQSDQAATISKDGACALNVLAGDVGVLFGTQSMYVQNKNGGATLTCHFDIDEDNLPDRTVRATGFGCNTLAGATNDSVAIASPGGNAILICRVKAGGPA